MRTCLLLLCALSACASPTTTDPPGKLDGEWGGEVQAYNVNLSLEQFGAYVRGGGLIADTMGTEAYMAIQGTTGDRRVSLTLTSVVYDALTLVGGWRDQSTLKMQIWGSGFFGDSITMRRRP